MTESKLAEFPPSLTARGPLPPASSSGLAATPTPTPTSATVPSSLLPGATVFSPTATPADDVLNPRSCVTCRKRKVRCDKHQPCHNCRRAGISCIFPAPGRAPRRPRPRDPNAPPGAAGSGGAGSGGGRHPSSDREAELMKRLRKLEGIVEELSGQIELESTRQNSSSAGGSPEAAMAAATPPPASTSTTQDTTAMMAGGGDGAAGGRGGGGATELVCPSMGNIGYQPIGGWEAPRSAPPYGAPGHSHRPLDDQAIPLGPRRTGDISKKFGRLVLHDDGHARYISSGFWSRINDELNELRAQTREMMESASEASGEEDTPEAHAEPEMPGSFGHNGFVFGYRSSDEDLRTYHPEPSQIPVMWKLFVENVQPLYMIFHAPTMSKTVSEVQNNLESLDPPTEALMFAIYLGAVTTLGEEEAKTKFGADKSFLLSQYRFALEQALARANFLVSSDFASLQALVLYVVLVRRRNDTRFAWTMAGLAVRIGQVLGLHRDPDNFPNLTPFEGEMRRRLFWMLIMVDFRAAEDQGTDMALADRTWDTRLPLNIDDADFGPDSTELPPDREGPTDMTFCHMAYEILPVGRRLHTLASAGAIMCPVDASSTLEDRERMLQAVYRRVERLYPRDGPNEGNALSWTAATVGRIILAKLTTIVYHSALFPGPGKDGPSDEACPRLKNRLLAAAVEVFEYGHLLYTDKRCKRWLWMFESFAQWQTTAYILMQLCQRPWSALSERAWFALNASFHHAVPAADIDRLADNAAVWVPFKRLYATARRHRAREVARLKANPAAAVALDEEQHSDAAAPTSFGVLSGSIKNAVAREKWRKLVGAPELPPTKPPILPWQLAKGGAPATTPPSVSRLPLSPMPSSTPSGAGAGGGPASAAARAGSMNMVDGLPGMTPTTTMASPTTAVTTAHQPTSTAPIASDFMDFMDQVMNQPTFAPSDFWPVVTTALDLRKEAAGAAGQLRDESGVRGGGGGAGSAEGRQHQRQPSPPQHQQAARHLSQSSVSDSPQSVQTNPPPAGPQQAGQAPTAKDHDMLWDGRRDYPPLWLWPVQERPYVPFPEDLRSSSRSTESPPAPVPASIARTNTNTTSTTTATTMSPTSPTIARPMATMMEGDLFPLQGTEAFDVDVNMDVDVGGDGGGGGAGADFDWSNLGETFRDFGGPSVGIAGFGGGGSIWGPSML